MRYDSSAVSGEWGHIDLFGKPVHRIQLCHKCYTGQEDIPQHKTRGFNILPLFL